jgi:Domain of unknown function (DUF4407)
MSKWLINISGARPDILAMCPTERVKFLSLGWAMLIAGVIAATSIWVALTSFIGLNGILAVPIATAAGFVVLGADRWLLVTLPVSGHLRWAWALPRLLFTVILGVIVATPLVVRVFQPEINSQIAIMKEQRAALFVDSQHNSSIGQQVDSLTSQVRSLGQIIDLGPKNLARYQEAKVELPAVQQELAVAIAQSNALQSAFYAANNADNGWLLRLQALNQLAAGNSTLDTAVLLLALLFTMMESLPVSVKLLQQPGTYDRILTEAARRELLSARKALLGITPAQVPLRPEYGYQPADADIVAIWSATPTSRSPLFALEPSDATEPELEPAESYEHTGRKDEALAMLEDPRENGWPTQSDGIPLRWDDDL